MYILTSVKPLRISKLRGQKQGSPFFSTHSFLLTLHLNSEKKLVCNVCGGKWMTHYYPFPSNSWILVRIGETLDIITTRSKSSRRTFYKQRGHCVFLFSENIWTTHEQECVFLQFLSWKYTLSTFTSMLYLFIFGMVGLHGCMQASRAYFSLLCTGFSLFWFLIAEHGPQANGLQQLQRAGSVVVARGLSCSTACEVFQHQGSNLYPLYWQLDSYLLFQQGSATRILFNLLSQDPAPELL